MDRISTFNINADMAALQTALTRADTPATLRDPIQAMVARIAAAAATAPVSVYVASSDETASLRDHFAYLLVRALSPQIPSALVVDCDFLNVGLSGLVPERDALGFLDLLLYGSSLGVITQESQGGVKTIGAGSFPVTKRMPFVLGAFEEAAHRLVAHARCAVFVGPLDEDDGGLHPLLGAVDVPVLVRELDAVRPGAVDPIEEQIASGWDSELLSVRLVGAAAPSDQMFAELLGDDDYDDVAPAPPAVPAPPPQPPREPALPPPPAPRPPQPAPSLTDLADPPTEERVHPPRPARPSDPALPQSSFGSTSPPPRRRRRGGVVALILLMLAVVFIGGRWFVLNRSQAPAGGEPVATAPAPTPAAAPQTTPSDTAAATRPDTVSSMAPGTTTGAEEPRVGTEPRRAELADTGGRSGGTVLIDPEDIHVIEEIRANWPDQYFVHISSFRKSVEARNEVAFLENHEFPVFIVFLDLDAKGKWYRVYAGPFKTRDEAREVKKSLDDIPTVRFTRITKIAE